MQSEPYEALQTATSEERSQNTESSLHHGQQEHQHAASGSIPHQDAASEPSAHHADNTDTLSMSSGDTTRGRQRNIGRIDNRNDSSQETSPGSRIDEYEKAHSTIRRQSDEILFQVIASRKGGTINVSIEEFPNGEYVEETIFQF